MTALIAILSFLHLFSAIAYIGSAMTFAFVIGPKLAKLSPTTSLEFFANVGPTFVRFTEAFGGMTILFGLPLLYTVTGGNMSELSISTPWGLLMTAGMATALVAFLIGMVIITRAAKGMVKHAADLLKNPGPPPKDMLRHQATLRQFSVIGLLLLVVTVAFMTVAATI